MRPTDLDVRIPGGFEYGTARGLNGSVSAAWFKIGIAPPEPSPTGPGKIRSATRLPDPTKYRARPDHPFATGEKKPGRVPRAGFPAGSV